jgi:putative nucleotidyltransferase with HDIG domain
MGDPPYLGRILRANFSERLKSDVMDHITSLGALDKAGTLGLAYISAWQEGKETIWYEYISRRFRDLLGCPYEDVMQVFRDSIRARRVYWYSSVDASIGQEILTAEQLQQISSHLREEAKATGTLEATYKITVKDDRSIWLKDKATIKYYEPDKVCLSHGSLMDVSKETRLEMFSSWMAQKAYDELEKRVQERTERLAKLNRQLKREIEERRRAELDRQRALDTLTKAMKGTVQAMAYTVETRDAYTAGHQQRVADLARAIARELNLSDDLIDGIGMASHIHDLGKIAVPAEILSKPTRLTEAELTIIKAHPEVGYEILKDVEFPWNVAEIVHQHHEKMNGSGYPRGLLGEHILLEARIMGIADVVEAMAYHRPYRQALGIDRALEEITRNRGTLYDPDVVDACLKLFSRKGFAFTGA